MKNPFRLPTPKELGIAKYNALPLRSFTPWEMDTCWEDYYDLLKKKYPVRFFLFNTLPDFVRYNIYFPIARPIKDGWYWIKSHTYRKYHLLDLRQPCDKDDITNIDCYQYGWCDVPEKMLYAMFNLLKEYFDEEPYDLTTHYTRVQIEADQGLKNQQHYYDEAKALLHWWQVERKQELTKIYQLQHDWHEARKDDTSPDDPDTKDKFLKLQVLEQEFQDKTDEMIARLMKIRRGLWT